MSVRAYDQFAGSTGTLLTAHTSPQGYGWAMHPVVTGIADATVPTLDGSGNISSTSGGTNAATFQFSPTADYEVQGRLTFTSLPGGYRFALRFRLDAAADTDYYWTLSLVSGTTYRWELYVEVGGTATFLAASASFTMTGTDDLYVKLGATGTSVSGSWQTAAAIAGSGWLTTTVSDSGVTGAGHGALQLRGDGSPSVGVWHDFRIQDVGTAYNAALPATAVASTNNNVAGATGTTVTITGTNTTWTSGTTWTASGAVSGSLTANITATSVTGQVATLTFTNPAAAQTITFSETVDGTSASVTVQTAATALTLSGPATGFRGVASSPFTLGVTPAGGAVQTGKVATPADGGAGGTFSPTTVAPGGTFTYTPAAGLASGTAVTITTTNNATDPIVANPAPFTYTVYSPNAIITGALTLTATFNSIGIEFLYSGDDNNNSYVTGQFKKHADSTWRNLLSKNSNGQNGGVGLENIGTTVFDGGSRGYYASVLRCSPGTQYDVRLTITDPDGVGGSATISGSVTTVAEGTSYATGLYDQRDPATLTPTYYVATTGSDTNAGTSSAAPWATLAHAVSQINGATQSLTAPPVVAVAPGYYLPASETAQNPITQPSIWLLGYVAGTGWVSPVTVTPTTRNGKVLQEITPANQGNRVVIYHGQVGVPVGTSDGIGVTGGWTAVTTAGVQNPGTNYTVYRWDGGGTLTTVDQVGWGVTKDMPPVTLPVWKQTSAVCTVSATGTPPAAPAYTLATARGFAEWVNTNFTAQHGWYYDGANLYLRMPGGVNPNGYWLWLGGHNDGLDSRDWPAGFVVNSPNVRIVGGEFRVCGSAAGAVLPQTRGVVVDHAFFGQGYRVLSLEGDITATPNLQPEDVLFQYNYCEHHGHADLAPVSSVGWVGTPGVADTHFCFPWDQVKGNSVAAGSVYNSVADHTLFLLDAEDSRQQTLVLDMNHGARRLVMRYNTITGWHDFGAVEQAAATDRYNAYDCDIYQNYVACLQDDGPEPVGMAFGWRVFDNLIERSATMLSFGNHCGQAYVFGNVAWRTGATQCVPHLVAGNPYWGGFGSQFLKYGNPASGVAASRPDMWHYVVGNTMYTDDTGGYSGGPGLTFTNGLANAAGSAKQRIYARNNLVVCTGNVAQVPSNVSGDDWWDEDYDHFFTTDTLGVSVMRYGYESGGPNTAVGTVAAYRTTTGNGTHSNLLVMGGTVQDFTTSLGNVEAQFTDPAPSGATEDLHLVSESGWRDLGVAVPNVSDLPITGGGDLSNGGYYGSSPDLGAAELLPPSLIISLFGSETPSGQAVRSTSAVRSGAVASAGAIIRGALHVASSSVSSAGQEIRRISRSVSGGVSPVSAASRGVGHLLSGAVGAVSGRVSGISHTLSGTISPTGTLATIAHHFVTFAGSVVPTSGRAFGVARSVLSSVTSLATKTVIGGVVRTGSVISSGIRTLATGRAFSGSVVSSGSTRLLTVMVPFLSAISSVGITQRQIAARRVGTVGQSGVISRQTGVVSSSTVASTDLPSVGRFIQRVYTSVQAGASQLVRAISLPLAASLAISGTVQRAVAFLESSSVSGAGVGTRLFPTVRSSVVVVVGNLISWVTAGIPQATTILWDVRPVSDADMGTPVVPLGQTIFCEAQLWQTNSLGQRILVDSTSLQLKLVDPNGVVTTTLATRDSVGHDHVKLVAGVAGRWSGKWISDPSSGIAPGVQPFRFVVVEEGV